MPVSVRCDEALHAYEAGMIDYGFRAVQTSREAMEQAMPESRLRALPCRGHFCARSTACHLSSGAMFRAMGAD